MILSNKVNYIIHNKFHQSEDFFNSFEKYKSVHLQIINLRNLRGNFSTQIKRPFLFFANTSTVPKDLLVGIVEIVTTRLDHTEILSVLKDTEPTIL